VFLKAGSFPSTLLSAAADGSPLLIDHLMVLSKVEGRVPPANRVGVSNFFIIDIAMRMPFWGTGADKWSTPKI
jgi:hypothetical protein